MMQIQTVSCGRKAPLVKVILLTEKHINKNSGILTQYRHFRIRNTSIQAIPYLTPKAFRLLPHVSKFANDEAVIALYLSDPIPQRTPKDPGGKLGDLPKSLLVRPRSLRDFVSIIATGEGTSCRYSSGSFFSSYYRPCATANEVPYSRGTFSVKKSEKTN